MPTFYVTGAALVILAAASCAFGDDQTRMLTVRLGAALLLWITCLSRLVRRTEPGLRAA